MIYKGPDGNDQEVEPKKANLPEIRGILEYIEANPEEWNQACWARRTDDLQVTSSLQIATNCGTAYCVAGHAIHRAGADAKFDGDGFATRCIDMDGNERHIETYATEILGLDGFQSDCLFNPTNTLEEMWDMVHEWEAAQV